MTCTWSCSMLECITRHSFGQKHSTSTLNSKVNVERTMITLRSIPQTSQVTFRAKAACAQIIHNWHRHTHTYTAVFVSHSNFSSCCLPGKSFMLQRRRCGILYNAQTNKATCYAVMSDIERMTALHLYLKLGGFFT